MKFLLFNIFFLSSTYCLTNTIPIYFDSKANFINCFDRTNFFKLNSDYLRTENLVINQNMNSDKVKWPVILEYKRRPKLKKYPFLPIPKMFTCEEWNYNFLKNQIYGKISTQFIDLDLLLELTKDKDNKLILQLTTNINNFSQIIPLNRDIIEKDLFEQIEDALIEVVPKMNLPNIHIKE